MERDYYKKVEDFSFLSGEDDKIASLGIALGNKTRVHLLRLVSERPRTITELSHALYISTSATLFHIDLLEKAQLVKTTYLTDTTRNTRLICADKVNFSLNFEFLHREKASPVKELSYEVGIGEYTNMHFTERCGMFLKDGSFIADPFSPSKRDMVIMWLNCGFVEYCFPIVGFRDKLLELDFTLEICSEAPQYRLDYKSDITFSLNGKEFAYYTCPSDFGGKRGKLNPEWWADSNTQYGQLIKIALTDVGSYVNGEKTSSVTIADFDFSRDNKLVFRIENKQNAVNRGGFNLFSKYMGDYEQDIIMTAIVSDDGKKE